MERLAQKHIILALLLLSLVVVVIAPFFGSVKIPVSKLLSNEPGLQSYLFWELRLPRVLLAYLVGAGLALSGAVFQGLFSNLLVTPFTLGVASGASFGAALYFKIGITFSFLGAADPVFWAFGGAMFAMLMVLFLAERVASASTVTLLLAGVVLSFFFSSFILFIQYLSDFTEIYLLTRWLMGSVEAVGYQKVITLGVVFFAVLIFTVFFYRELNLLSLGREMALTRGVNVKRFRLLFYAVISFLVATIVALCGIISFVGIVVPYLSRLMVGSHHGRLLPVTVLLGGSFLVFCDTIARTIIMPSQIPVGVITAMLGAPFFIWLLFVRAKGLSAFSA